MNRLVAYAATALICFMTGSTVLFPQSAPALWRGFIWALFAVSVVVAAAVAINIISVSVSMYFGYREDQNESKVLSFPESPSAELSSENAFHEPSAHKAAS